MPSPVAYSVAQELTSPLWAEAFARGCGGKVNKAGKLEPGDVALFGSLQRVDLLRQAEAEGRDWYFGDHGYFGRDVYYRCTRRALQHDGHGDSDGVQFDAFGLEIAPWRRRGRHILICPPDQPWGDFNGFSAEQWLANISGAIEAATKRPIIVRHRRETRPLAADLAEAHILVTHTSNAAVEALLAGVPVLCTAPCAARRMGLTRISEIEDPVLPKDRRRWAGVLADNQWTLQEMMDGVLWETMAAKR